MSDAVKSIGRRLFARATMGLPFVLKSGAHMQPPPSPVGFGLASGNSPATAGQISLTEKIWTAMRKGTRAEAELADLRYTKRAMMGGLDLDLSVLNSMSHQHRVIRQIERTKAEQERYRGLRATIIRSLGGKPEDFE